MKNIKLENKAIGPLHLGMTRQQTEEALNCLLREWDPDFDSPISQTEEEWYGFEGSCVRYIFGQFSALFLVHFNSEGKSVCITFDSSVSLYREVLFEEIPVFSAEAAEVIYQLNQQHSFLCDSENPQTGYHYVFPQLGIDFERADSICYETASDFMGEEGLDADDFSHFHLLFVRLFDPNYLDALSLHEAEEILPQHFIPKLPNFPKAAGELFSLQIGLSKEQAEQAVAALLHTPAAQTTQMGRFEQISYRSEQGQICVWYDQNQKSVAFQTEDCPAFPVLESFPQLNCLQGVLESLSQKDILVCNCGQFVFPHFGVSFSRNGEHCSSLTVFCPSFWLSSFMLGIF